MGKSSQADVVSTPLRTLLGTWVHEGQRTSRGDPVVSLLCRSQYITFEHQLKYLFVRVYDALEGKLYAKW